VFKYVQSSLDIDAEDISILMTLFETIANPSGRTV